MVVSQGLDPGSESCCTQRQMGDGACASNQVSRLRISKLTAGGKLQSTWDYNMPLCWLIQPTIRLNKLRSLPIAGNGVVALAVVNGEGPAPVLPSPKILKFSGYEWTTSTGPIFRAGSRNFFDPANVWTDEKGALHLRISGSPGKWAAAELKLTRSLGYGTYSFQVRDVSHLEPSALLTLITWDGVGTESNRHELDVELGRWGYPDNTNVNYVVQPYYVPANFLAFRVPPGALHTFLSVGTGASNVFDGSRIGQYRCRSCHEPARVYLRCAFTGGRIGTHRLVCISSRPCTPEKR